MKRNILIITLSFTLILQIIGGILYLYKFQTPFSHDSNDWANFSTFHSYFLGWANLIIIGIISYYATQATETFNKLQLRPILFFTIDKPMKINSGFKDSWYLKNGAKNAALNIMVKFTYGNNESTKWVSCFSLSENESLELFWIQYAEVIQIAYSDLTNEKFYLYTIKDYDGVAKEISKKEFSEILENAKENRKNNYIALRDKLEHYFSKYSEENISKEDLIKSYLKNFIKPQIG